MGTRTILTLGTLGAILAAGVVLYPTDPTCYRALAQMPCVDAKALGPDAIDCVDGEAVVPVDLAALPGELVEVESTDDKGVTSRTTVAYELPAGTVLLDAPRPIDCRDIRREGEVLTARALADPAAAVERCIAGHVRRDVSELGDRSRWREWAPGTAACRTAPKDGRCTGDGPHVCCGAKCECLDEPCAAAPPVGITGRPTWRTRLLERRPDLIPSGL